MDWRQSEVLELISMYRESECLWNPRSPDYKDMDLKRSAWKEFAEYFLTDVDEVKKKIKNLRTNYLMEKKKCDAKKAAGEEYEPRLYYYDEMNFLAPIIFLRVCILPQQKEYPVNENGYKSSTSSSAKRKRFDYDDETRDDDGQSSQCEESITRQTQSDFNTNSIDMEQIRTDSPTQIQHDEVTTQDEPASKEELFCTMLSSELKLIKSEDIYDSVTSEIFTLVKNAKMAERQIIYQPEENAKYSIRIT